MLKHRTQGCVASRRELGRTLQWMQRPQPGLGRAYLCLDLVNAFFYHDDLFESGYHRCQEKV